MIIDQLRKGEFEVKVSLVKQFFYWLERTSGNLLFRRFPPQGQYPRLLNLGCGPVTYEGWINADEYAFKRTLREKRFRPDWRLDITRPWKCENNYWDGIFSQHVIEHVTYSDAVFVLQECFRTLKPGSWIRVSVPSIKRYVEFYEGRNSAGFFSQFPYKALAISFLTQMHFHKSAWDGELMKRVLVEIGFENAHEVNYGEGTDKKLIKDQDVKAEESLYVEAQKPFVK
jgi:predicted SAM-dependent methyltransferase